MAARRTVRGEAPRRGNPDLTLPPAFAARERPSRSQLLAAPLRWPRPGRVTAPVTSLRGIGPSLSQLLASELGIATVADLLMHLPRAYEAAPKPVGVDQLEPGAEATLLVRVGTVGRFQPSGPPRRGSRRKGRLEVTVADLEGQGSTRAIWFNQPWLAESLTPGDLLRLAGRMERAGFVVSDHEKLELAGNGIPTLRQLAAIGWRGEGEVPAAIHQREPIPLHPATERVKARQLRRHIWQALGRAEDMPEPLPGRLRARLRLPALADSLRAVHFPALTWAGEEAAEEARRRLAFAELAQHQLELMRRRAERRDQRAPSLRSQGDLEMRWRSRLPFQLTADQERAVEEVWHDLAAERPMVRLLMGEVGSGKTVVALAAMLRAVAAGHQAALLAPTEVLAEQHAGTIRELLAGLDVGCGLLTGSTPARERKELLAHLAAGRLGLLVGTHALLEEPVRFRSLALAVVDEQHRFGVRQRASLDSKAPPGRLPHTLHMSATPIPRTLALLGYGDLDLSVLRGLPAGRQPIVTRLVEPGRREDEFGQLRRSLREGRQAYVICPLVTESEALQAKAALAEAERLAEGELAGFGIDVLHGRLPAADKRQVMARFAAGETQVLVATTVVEVGVDVPNASWIVIEGAERFGLSQLHQLRGRVGRGEHPSTCLLVPGELGLRARQRLEALVAESDGFRLAELDLKLRGAGEILGSRQHGLPGFHAARLPQDGDLLELARKVAAEMASQADAGDPCAELFAELAAGRYARPSTRGIAA